MTEKFKTKYHALAWAAEDVNNVFVDGEGDCVKFDNGEVVCAPQWNDYRVLENVDQIIEPCHKLEVEKPSLQEQIDELKKQVEEIKRNVTSTLGLSGATRYYGAYFKK